MTIAIMQPGYLPWPGFFELIYRSDIFVIYDNVQYDKNGWRNRNRIKTSKGYQWLTVPVHIRGKPMISEVRIDNSRNWPEDHLRALEFNYNKAPYFKKYFNQIKELLGQKWELLIDLDLALIKVLSQNLGFERKIVLSSDFKISNDSDKVGRLIDICKKFGAKVFYEPAGGKDYLANEVEHFKKEGIELIFQNFQCPEYPQLFGAFIPNLSILDLLFNMGENSLNYITCPNSKF